MRRLAGAAGAPAPEQTVSLQLRRQGTAALASWYSAQRTYSKDGSLGPDKAAAIAALDRYGRLTADYAPKGLSDEQLLGYLRRFVQTGGRLTAREYDRWALGLPDEIVPGSDTIRKRLGWARALLAVGARPTLRAYRRFDPESWPQHLAEFKRVTRPPYSMNSYNAWIRDRPQAPAARMLKDAFGSFPAAVSSDLGLPPKSARDSMTRFVQAGVGLTTHKYDSWHRTAPSTVSLSYIYRNVGRDWPAALALGGATPKQINGLGRHARTTPEQSLRRFRRTGRPPTRSDYEEWWASNKQETSVHALVKAYGDLARAFAAASMHQQRRPAPAECGLDKMLGDVRPFHSETGQTYSRQYTQWRAGNPAITHCETIRKRFRSWPNAIAAALRDSGAPQFQPAMAGVSSPVQRQLLIAIAWQEGPVPIKDLAQQLGLAVRTVSYHKHQLCIKGLAAHLGRGLVDIAQPELRRELRQQSADSPDSQRPAAPAEPARRQPDNPGAAPMSDRQLLGYVQRFAATGRPPEPAEYVAWARAVPGAPSLSVINAQAGRWDRALRQAGIQATPPPNDNPCDPDSWSQHLATFRRDTEPPYTASSYRWWSGRHPQAPGYLAVRHTFGSFADAVRTGSGLAPRSAQDSMAKFVQAGVGLLMQDYRRWRQDNPDAVPLTYVRQTAGLRWAAALELGGASPQQLARARQPQRPRVDAAQALTSLRRFQQTGLPRTITAYEKWQRTNKNETSLHHLSRIWGSWHQALQAAGIPPYEWEPKIAVWCGCGRGRSCRSQRRHRRDERSGWHASRAPRSLGRSRS